MRILKYILPIVVLSFFFYKMTIKYVPDVIYSRVKSKMLGQSAIQENELRLLPFPDENSRAVVMPNPDFAYVSMFYDLSDGPLHVTGKMPDSTYWSVALYEPNTSNHFVKNDMQYGNSNLNIVIGNLDQKPTLVSGAELINSPTKEGFLLLRLLGTERSDEERQKMIELMKNIKTKQVI